MYDKPFYENLSFVCWQLNSVSLSVQALKAIRASSCLFCICCHSQTNKQATEPCCSCICLVAHEGKDMTFCAWKKIPTTCSADFWPVPWQSLYQLSFFVSFFVSFFGDREIILWSAFSSSCLICLLFILRSHSDCIGVAWFWSLLSTPINRSMSEEKKDIRIGRFHWLCSWLWSPLAHTHSHSQRTHSHAHTHTTTPHARSIPWCGHWRVAWRHLGQHRFRIALSCKL